MNSPMSPVLNTRETYSKWLQKVITEVEVQFENEEPAWIPYDTLIAIMNDSMKQHKKSSTRYKKQCFIPRRMVHNWKDTMRLR